MKKSVPLTFLKLFIASIALLLGSNSISFAQAVAPFGCNGNFYVTYSQNDYATTPTSIDKVMYNGIGVAATYLGTTNNFGFDGADISPIDGFMYGCTYTNGADVSLIKIDSNANVTVVGNLPSFVTSTQSIFAGCFDANGDFYICNTPPAGSAANIYKVNTADASAVLVGSTGVLPDAPDAQLFFVDLSIDPTSGIMYGASNYCCGEVGGSSQALYSIDKTTGLATEIGQFTTASGYHTTGYGLFFSFSGDLFLYGTDANFYLVNKATAEITPVGSGPSYAFADGAGCPFRIDHTLAAASSAICLVDSTSTTNFPFTETFINNRGTVISGAGYHLALDKRFQFTESAAEIKDTLVTLGIATSATTVTISDTSGGTNNLIDISPINIPYSGPGTKTSFILNTLFTNSSGVPTIAVASDVYNLPTVIGGSVLSDNPATLILNDSTTISLCNAGSLPVTFVSLNAIPNTYGNVLVQWQVADEINVKSYEVDRSTDGVNFSAIGNVAATNAGNYQYTDNTASGNDKLYYRVKSIDISGKIEYTPTVAVTLNQKQSIITATPNPFQDDLQLQIQSSKNQPAEVRIFGVDGKSYQTYNLQVSKGASVNTLKNTTSLPSGVYAIFVNMVGTGEVFSIKVVKQ
jgi:hypothetical protein